MLKYRWIISWKISKIRGRGLIAELSPPPPIFSEELRKIKNLSQDNRFPGWESHLPCYRYTILLGDQTTEHLSCQKTLEIYRRKYEKSTDIIYLCVITAIYRNLCSSNCDIKECSVCFKVYLISFFLYKVNQYRQYCESLQNYSLLGLYIMHSRNTDLKMFWNILITVVKYLGEWNTKTVVQVRVFPIFLRSFQLLLPFGST
jgi:hypothetical protein